jgi:hypothetical protein
MGDCGCRLRGLDSIVVSSHFLPACSSCELLSMSHVRIPAIEQNHTPNVLPCLNLVHFLLEDVG